MKITYTEAGNLELRSFQDRQKRLLEELISERKYIYGDEVLEVTASDIKEVASLIRPVSRLRTRFRSVHLLGRAYIIVGSLIAIAAFLYPYFVQMLQENKSQATLLLGGICVALVGVFAHFYANMRERRFDAMERDMRERWHSIAVSVNPLGFESKSRGETEKRSPNDLL